MPVLTPENPERSQTQAPVAISGRLTSLDAYRGFVMLLIMAEALQLWRVAAARPENGFWRFLTYH
jgi:hypothetical protein